MSTPESPPDDAAPWWKQPEHKVALIVAIIGAAGLIIAAILSSSKEGPDTSSSPATSAPITNTIGNAQPTPPPPPPPAAAARPKKLRLLLAIDRSWSMRKLVREGNETRIHAAARGALDGLERIKRPYEVGLWAFHGLGLKLPEESPPIAPYEGTHKWTIRRELARLQRASPSGATPFYRTIELGVKTLQDEARDDDPTDPTINVLLLLTDGGDRPSKKDRNPMLARHINALLRRTRDVAVVTTAAYDTSCGDLADKGVPELQVEPHRCHNVGVDVQIGATLNDIVDDLQKLRKR